jgi:hypothetical protein
MELTNGGSYLSSSVTFGGLMNGIVGLVAREESIDQQKIDLLYFPYPGT